MPARQPYRRWIGELTLAPRYGQKLLNDDMRQAALANLAAWHLPTRLDVTATTKLLGFAEHDIQILMAAGKLVPLGDPVSNAPKWFCMVEIIELAAEKE
jgi:hypothetical protein